MLCALSEHWAVVLTGASGLAQQLQRAAPAFCLRSRVGSPVCLLHMCDLISLVNVY